MQTAGLQQGAKQGGSSLVVCCYVAPEVGLIGGPVDRVQLAAQGRLQALKCPLPLLNSGALCLALPSLRPTAAMVNAAHWLRR